MSDADVGALRETYRDLAVIERRPEEIRYSATLADGTPVVAVAFSDGIAARVRHQERFDAALARAATIRHNGIAAPVRWGRAPGNRLHCAFARASVVELTPGTLSPSDVAVIGVQLCGALDAIHGAGLVHGGISTGAIAQSQEHGAQLARFGVFCALSEGGLGVQGAALALEDSAYVSPEVEKGQQPNAHSDIYSLGASLYELLTGKPPYGGRTTSFVMASVLSDQAGAAEQSNDAIAGPVIEALMRAIERAPEDRWPTAAAFGQALAIGAGSVEMAAVDAEQKTARANWISAILNRWFPARRSRAE